MFKKNDFKLKEDFRKLLLSTDAQYQTEINTGERKAIIFMWNKIIDDNGGVAVVRFRKQGFRLGIMIKTVKSNLGFLHEITNIAEKSEVSKCGLIQTGDTLLEVNGVNLLLLNYSQLVLTLGSLPNNVQFVLWKKEGEGVYEKPDYLDSGSLDDHYPFSKENTSWMSAVQIIVNGSKTKPHGLEFMRNMPERREISKCILQKIHRDGFFFEDQRVSINDSIDQLNGLDLRSCSDKEALKAFSGNKRSALLVRLRKYQCWGYFEDSRSISGSKLSLPITYKEIPQSKKLYCSNPNTLSKKSPSNHSISKSSTIERSPVESPSLNVMLHDTITVTLDPSDDLKIYLVDVSENGKHKSIICGFHPESSLRTKFRFKDEIIKVNEEDVHEKSSKEIGTILKNLVQRKGAIIISVIRPSKGDPKNDNENLIIPSEMFTSDFKTSSNADEDVKDGTVIDVTLRKIDDSFGLRVKVYSSPTITEIIPDSSADKSGLIMVGDIINAINGIYVKDKDNTFILTMIRSCGEEMNLQIVRKTFKNEDVSCTENETYFIEKVDQKTSERSGDKDHPKYLPLPPLPPIEDYESKK